MWDGEQQRLWLWQENKKEGVELAEGEKAGKEGLRGVRMGPGNPSQSASSATVLVVRVSGRLDQQRAL